MTHAQYIAQIEANAPDYDDTFVSPDEEYDHPLSIIEDTSETESIFA